MKRVVLLWDETTMDNHGYQEGLILRLHMMQYMHMFACLQGEFNELLLIRANSFSRSCPRSPKDSHVQVHCAQVAWAFTSLEYSLGGFGGIWGNKNLGLNSKRASCTCLPALVACEIFAWFFCLPIWLKQCSRELFIDTLLVTGPWRRRSESNLRAIVQLCPAVLAQVLGIKRHRVRCRSPDFGNPNFWTNMFFSLAVTYASPWAVGHEVIWVQ